MGMHLARHNTKILSSILGTKKSREPKCNCLKSRKKECPLPGACNQFGVVYQAEVNMKDEEPEFYIGLARDFEARWYKHHNICVGTEGQRENPNIEVEIFRNKCQ